MSLDPKITDTLLYGYRGGDRLCMEQRTFRSCVWDDEWVVFGDQVGQFGEDRAKHVAVQFRLRPARRRYVAEPPAKTRVKEFEDA